VLIEPLGNLLYAKRSLDNAFDIETGRKCPELKSGFALFFACNHEGDFLGSSHAHGVMLEETPIIIDKEREPCLCTLKPRMCRSAR